MGERRLPAGHGRQPILQLQLERHAAPGQGRPEAVQGGPHRGGEIGGAGLGRLVGPGVEQELAQPAVEPVDLAHDVARRLARLLEAVLKRELGRGADRGQGVADVVRDRRGHAADRGQCLGVHQPLLLAADHPAGATHDAEQDEVEEGTACQGAQPDQAVPCVDGGEQRPRLAVDLDHRDHPAAVLAPDRDVGLDEAQAGLGREGDVLRLVLDAHHPALDRQLALERLLQLAVGPEAAAGEAGRARPDDGAVAGEDVGPDHVRQVGDVPEERVEDRPGAGSRTQEVGPGLLRPNDAVQELGADLGVARQHLAGEQAREGERRDGRDQRDADEAQDGERAHEVEGAAPVRAGADDGVPRVVADKPEEALQPFHPVPVRPVRRGPGPPPVT